MAESESYDLSPKHRMVIRAPYQFSVWWVVLLIGDDEEDIVIGAGKTRQAAISKAVPLLEKALDALQQPPEGR